MSKLFVISVGGSLIVPEEIDANFLKNFKTAICGQIKKGARFILITGGGKTCRKYQSALKAAAKPTSLDLDWLGIYTTRLNARLLRMVFGKLANPEIIESSSKKVNFKEKILISGGEKPGRSTDWPSIMLAKTYGAETLINLSNVNYIYDKDPNKFKDAKKIKNISWKDYLKIVGNKWTPGANWPFDPTAAKFAQKHKLRVIICNGNNIYNLKRVLNNQPFIGTAIT